MDDATRCPGQPPNALRPEKSTLAYPTPSGLVNVRHSYTDHVRDTVQGTAQCNHLSKADFNRVRHMLKKGPYHKSLQATLPKPESISSVAIPPPPPTLPIQCESPRRVINFSRPKPATALSLFTPQTAQNYRGPESFQSEPYYGPSFSGLPRHETGNFLAGGAAGTSILNVGDCQIRVSSSLLDDKEPTVPDFDNYDTLDTFEACKLNLLDITRLTAARTPSAPSPSFNGSNGDLLLPNHHHRTEGSISIHGPDRSLTRVFYERPDHVEDLPADSSRAKPYLGGGEVGPSYSVDRTVTGGFLRGFRDASERRWNFLSRRPNRIKPGDRLREDDKISSDEDDDHVPDNRCLEGERFRDLVDVRILERQEIVPDHDILPATWHTVPKVRPHEPASDDELGTDTPDHGMAVAAAADSAGPRKDRAPPPTKAPLVFKRVRKRLVNKYGSTNVVQSNISNRKQHFLSDIYTTMLDSRWRWSVLIFALGFLLSWTLFSVVWWLICFSHGDFEHAHDPGWRPCFKNAYTFTSVFLFSIETQHTIGYGYRHITEECPEGVLLFVIQSIAGAMIQGFVIGLIFSKLSRPKKRAVTLMFSRTAVVCTRDGQPCLLVRIGDMRRSHIIDARTRAYLFRKKVTLEGEVIPLHPHHMPLSFDPFQGPAVTDRIFLAWPSILVHRIDEHSPLYNLGARDLGEEKFEIVVILEGMIEASGMSMQARTSYLPHEIVWGHRFQKLITFVREDGDYNVDYSAFHHTVPFNMPLCSARDLDVLRSKYREEHGKLVRSRGRLNRPTTGSSQSTESGKSFPEPEPSAAAQTDLTGLVERLESLLQDLRQYVPPPAHHKLDLPTAVPKSPRAEPLAVPRAN